MMKTKYFLFALVIWGGISFRGQAQADSSIRERVYIQTDKKLYLAGELVWLKIITTTENGIPLNFSKVGYIELLDLSGAKAQAKLELRNGQGNGTLVLPANLPTGCYRLVAYTRYMRNESPEVFFEKVIGIVNPVLPEVPVPEQTDLETFPQSSALTEGQLPSEVISVATDNKKYSPRSQVNIRIDQLPENIHTLSVSVAGRDYTYSFAEPGLGQWKQELRNIRKGPVSNDLLAEYEGHIINGRLTETATGNTARASHVTPILAFPGNDIQLFFGKVSPQGDVTFQTQRTDGYTDAVTSIAGVLEDNYRIELFSPFIPAHEPKALPLLDLTRIDRDRLLNQSVGVQIQYAYLNDSLMQFRYLSPHFFYTPDNRYIMEEYRKFGTMEEVIHEYVTFVRFRTMEGRRYLMTLQENLGFSNRNTLVLLDGIPIFNHDIIYQYNPLLLQRIDVYFGQYIFGGARYEGIVALYTDNNNYPELIPDPATHFVSYESPQASRLFYAPDYSKGVQNRLPDYRHTLYWDPNVQTGGHRTIHIPFYISDITGDFRVMVEGMTENGEVVYATTDFQVM